MRPAQRVRLVGEPHVQRVPVGLGVDGDAGAGPASRQARATRTAISPRLAMRTLLQARHVSVSSARGDPVLAKVKRRRVGPGSASDGWVGSDADALSPAGRPARRTGASARDGGARGCRVPS